MFRPAPGDSAAPSHPPRRGFTLVELLAVIFIIALLTFLILGAVHYAQRSSKISKTKADLAAISMALEQFHSDFKTYPGMAEPVPPATIKRTILAQALIGPGPAAEDGAEGSGFRIPNLSIAGGYDPTSKHWPAYLSPEHFQVKRFPLPNGPWAILDYFGNPIRYLPQRRTFNPRMGPLVGTGANIGLFDPLDGEHPNTGAIDLTALTLQAILGDNGDANPPKPNNVIDGNETFRPTSSFILASSGADGIFSRAEDGLKFSKSDDIFNFEHK